MARTALRNGSLAALTALFFVCGGPAIARELSFEERVDAQERIARVYYRHTLGVTKPFEQAVSRDVLERKVRTYLEQSAALERIWRTPVTADALARELERIATHTRFPDRLREVFAALDDDPFLIQECLARPALAGRLSRRSLASDESIHARARAEAEAERARRAWRDVRSVARSELPSGALRALSGGSCPAPDSWDPRNLGSALDARSGHTTVWTGAEMIVWGGINGPASGDRYDPLTDSWSEVSSLGSPTAAVQVAVWTGNVMVVFGGASVGGRYNPSTDTWQAMSAVNAPQTGYGPAVWSGSEMILCGGGNVGGRYNPSTDTWQLMSAADAPQCYLSTAVWAGTEMIVWGGDSSGRRYNPQTDTWTPMATAPIHLYGHTAVWTGSRMIVWGGFTDPELPTLAVSDRGASYDPQSNSWSSIANAPTPRRDHRAVWTGSAMIVWGGIHFEGFGDTVFYHDDGVLYDPLTNQWSTLSETGAPPVYGGFSAVWTGSRFLVWGGIMRTGDHVSRVNQGGRYDPQSDSWLATATPGPSPGIGAVTVWTGTDMLVWGSGRTDTGARYDTILDEWSPMSSTGAPSAHSGAVGVWTGQEMIVWGGVTGSGNTPTDTGGRYDPLTDTWSATSLVGAPAPGYAAAGAWMGSRMLVFSGGIPGLSSGGIYEPSTDRWTPISTHGAPQITYEGALFWTGREALVWDGQAGQGGRYDPVADAWSPMTTTNGRYGPTLVWTGSELLIWGGREATASGAGDFLDTGARYSPQTDSWTAMATFGAPSPRWRASLVWTGGRAIVWGGGGGGGLLDTGGVYDPASDSWTATSSAGAPAPRDSHIGIWADDFMLVFGGGRNDGAAYFIDADADGLTDPCDNCALASNASQADGDGDGAGDVCDECAGAPDLDLDRDGYPACLDCDDERADVWPGAPDFCDSVNNDCDDPSWPSISGTFASDQDGDGYVGCALWLGSDPAVLGGDDCDPTDAGSHPGAAEACDGRDNDCIPLNEPPGEPEICNGVDDDCDGLTDEDQLGEDTDEDSVHNRCDNCRTVSNPSQIDTDGDGLGDACDACPLFPPGSENDSEGEYVESWAYVAVASSEYSSGDYSASQAAGLPESAGVCDDRPTNWSPLGSTSDPEWIELSYPVLVHAIGVNVHESQEERFVRQIELREPTGAYHTAWNGTDNTTCGNVLEARFPMTPYAVDRVRVHTAAPAWEEIDAVELLGVHTTPDGIIDPCDNCPEASNATQADLDGDGAGDACDCDPANPAIRPAAEVLVVLVEPLEAGALRLSWSATAGAASYAVIRGQLSALSATHMGDCQVGGLTALAWEDAELPAPGQGFSYLVRGESPACGPGTLGWGIYGVARVNTGGACPG